MNLKELKGMRIGDLTEIAKKMNVDGAAGLKKQELIFAILQSQTDQEAVSYTHLTLPTIYSV